MGRSTVRSVSTISNRICALNGGGGADWVLKLELEVLDKRRRYLGENNPATFVAKTNLATTYFNQSRLDEAERLELEVLQGRQQVFGKSHWLTLQSMNNLLNTYIEQGRMEDCEHMMTFLLETSLAKAEPDPRLQPSILEKANRLCSVYKESGRLQSLSKLEAKMDMLQRQSTTWSRVIRSFELKPNTFAEIGAEHQLPASPLYLDLFLLRSYWANKISVCFPINQYKLKFLLLWLAVAYVVCFVRYCSPK